MKKIISLILVCVLCLSLSAFTTAEGSVGATERTEELYRIKFEDGVSYGTSVLQSTLTSVSANLEEVVFTVDAGFDTFTIGYYLGNENFSPKEIYEGVSKAVDDLKQAIISEERISSRNTITLSDLELDYILVRSSPEDITTFAKKLVNTKEIKRITTAPTETELVEHRRNIQSAARANTINGSYHYPDIIVDQVYTLWHNQLTGNDGLCATSLSAPHSGDGNNRYESGYQWFPDYVDVNFYTDIAENENRTWLWYKYNQATLNNLNVDSNEALEMEVVFYNYNKSSTSYNQKGNAYQLIKSGSTWATNQPNSYRDTNFLDNSQEVSFCVGVDDTTDLVANRWYYWYINGTKGTTENNYPNDGRFKVIAQRGYRLLGGGAWSVFAEEHEPIRALGLASNQSWVPATESAWIYAEDNDDWNFDASIDPVK